MKQNKNKLTFHVWYAFKTLVHRILSVCFSSAQKKSLNLNGSGV